MFALNALVYPCVLAALCVGAGLLVDRCSGGFLPGALLPAVGAAALIALSQLTTYVSPLAPGDALVLVALAAAGYAVARPRARAARCGAVRGVALEPAVPVLAYVLALAPVLCSGRPSFSSYMALSDSAVHMMGADFLLHHGQDYAHLDLRNSYGQFINDYYNTELPLGRGHAVRRQRRRAGAAADLGLSAVQRVHARDRRRAGLAAGAAHGPRGAWAALAALTATVPALVYAYELIGSIKEITALGMILALGRARRAAPRAGCADARSGARSRSRWSSPRASPRWARPSARGSLRGGASVLARRRSLADAAQRAAPRRGRGARCVTLGGGGAGRAARRPADVGPPVGLGAGGPEHRLDEQPGQPAHAAARRSRCSACGCGAATSTRPRAAIRRSRTR